jgi:hypothetical protein
MNGESDDRPTTTEADTAKPSPLSDEERAAATTRVLTAHPDWSDRAVAAVTGLSTRRVSRLRKGTAAESVGRRVGRDGRARPVDPAQGRELAGRLLRSNPEASLRQIAAAAGLAPATVADVRDRISRGEPPVPESARRPAPPGTGPEPPRETGPAPLPARRTIPAPQPTPAHVLRIFDSLRRDPSLRLNESGRTVLRMLGANVLIAQDRRKIVALLPAHCRDAMAQLAQGYAGLWRLLAEELAADDTRAVPAASGEEAAPLGV